MKMRAILALMTMAACTPSGDLTMTTVTVSGRSFDVQYDPYAPDRATIFGKPNVLVFQEEPFAEIVAAATPCQLDEGSFVQEFSNAPHPTNPELKVIRVVQLDCEQAS